MVFQVGNPGDIYTSLDMAQLTGTVNDVTGTVNWHSKSSHNLTGTVNTRVTIGILI